MRRKQFTHRQVRKLNREPCANQGRAHRCKSSTRQTRCRANSPRVSLTLTCLNFCENFCSLARKNDFLLRSVLFTYMTGIKKRFDKARGQKGRKKQAWSGRPRIRDKVRRPARSMLSRSFWGSKQRHGNMPILGQRASGITSVTPVFLWGCGNLYLGEEGNA